MSSFVSAFVVEWWLENSFSVHSRHFLGWSVDRSGCTLGRWRTLWRILLPLRAPNLDLTMAKTFTITPLILILVFFDKNKLVLMPLQRILETSLTYAVLDIDAVMFVMTEEDWTNRKSFKAIFLCNIIMWECVVLWTVSDLTTSLIPPSVKCLLD